jgi:hypothetical protein
MPVSASCAARRATPPATDRRIDMALDDSQLNGIEERLEAGPPRFIAILSAMRWPGRPRRASPVWNRYCVRSIPLVEPVTPFVEYW